MQKSSVNSLRVSGGVQLAILGELSGRVGGVKHFWRALIKFLNTLNILHIPMTNI